jgi:hypothetical protein
MEFPIDKQEIQEPIFLFSKQNNCFLMIISPIGYKRNILRYWDETKTKCLKT